MPWPVEAGASRALAPSGNSYIARPQEGGRFALFYGGLHIGDHGDAAGCIYALEVFGEQERIYKREQRGEALWRALAEAKAAQDRLAAIRPATLEGLLAKLRHAAARTHRAPAFVAQHAALMGAIAWLDPPKPKPRRASPLRAPKP